jgi:hypothetical protein
MNPEQRQALRAILGKKDEPTPEMIAAAKAIMLRRQQVEATETELSEQKQRLRRAEDNLFRLLDEAGITKIAFNGLEITGCTSDHYAVTEATLQRNDFLLWLTRSGGHDQIRRSVNASSFSHYCRKLIESGKNLPSVWIKKVRRRWFRILEISGDS